MLNSNPDSTRIAFLGKNLKPPTHRGLLIACLLTFLTALGVRILYLQDNSLEFEQRNSPFHMVADFYYTEAQRMFRDGAILFPGDNADPGNAEMIIHPPGYSMLMAAVNPAPSDSNSIREPARSNSRLRIIQIIGDSVSVVLLLLLSAKLLPFPVAVIGSLLAAISPHFAYYSLFISPDSLVALPILLAIFLVVRATKKPHLLTIAAAGVMVGVSCWLRSNALLLAPFLCLLFPLLVERGKRLRYSLAMLISTFLVILPITVRNWIVYGEFIPVSLGAGITLIEGIADYDRDSRFQMPRSDEETIRKDVEWHNRPDYEASLWKPDGVFRDRARFARGIEVIQSNPGWFVNAMLRRISYMLRYNDFDPQETPFTTIAPALRSRAPFGHDPYPGSEAAPVWFVSPAEMIASGSILSSQADVYLSDTNGAIVLDTRSASGADLFSSALIPVRKDRDYLMSMALSVEQGSFDAKVGTADPRIALAQNRLIAPGRKKSRREMDDTSMGKAIVAFSSGDNSEVRLVFADRSGERAGSRVRIGSVELFEFGPTPHTWTRYPRALLLGVQKNLYKTDLMRLLILTGIVLLAVARRTRALALLLAVPAYFLSLQSTLHTEYRYTLPMHYFLFAVAASSIYSAGIMIERGVRALHRRVRRASAL